jgi:pyridoxal phosphate enzyme (YggS family)
MVGMSVADRLDHIREKIARACAISGRKTGSVNLLAVSKHQSLRKIFEAYEHGQVHFAENYVQESLAKIEQLRNLPVNWHFIGRIQGNKAKYLPGNFTMIHSVDRASIADAINRRKAQLEDGLRQKVFLQYNVAHEATKAGVDEIEMENLINFVRRLSHIEVVGLMVMPPLEIAAEAVRPHFRQAREFLDRIRSGMPAEVLRQHPLDQLSMGTSHDYEVAISEGATWVRIGTGIFGPREGQGVLQ